MKKPSKQPVNKIAPNQKNKKSTAARGTDEAPEIPETEKVVEAVLPFMYASKSAEYVFGAELGDGFVTVSIPKDRFPREPGAVLVTVEIVEAGK